LRSIKIGNPFVLAEWLAQFGLLLQAKKRPQALLKAATAAGPHVEGCGRMLSTKNHRESPMLKLRTAAAALALCASGFTLAAEPLTVSQIEKVTGLSGLSVKPGKYDKSSQNYVTSKNELAVTVKLASASVYDVWKSQPSMSDQAPLSGLGEDAISSKKGRYICFKKGSAGICVAGMVSLRAGQPLVSDAMLLELARLAASNL